MGPHESRTFLQLVAVGHAGHGTQGIPIPEFMQLSAEAFEVVSAWYHYAILELTFVPGCKADPKWIAKKLGITHVEAAQALGRLAELGLLEIKNGRPIKTEAHITTSDGIFSAALRRRHQEILKKAATSIEQDSIEARDFSSMTMSIDPKLLPEAKRRIAAFRRELCSFLESSKRNQVYELSVQLFPLSKGELNEGRKS